MHTYQRISVIKGNNHSYYDRAKCECGWEAEKDRAFDANARADFLKHIEAVITHIINRNIPCARRTQLKSLKNDLIKELFTQ